MSTAAASRSASCAARRPPEFRARKSARTGPTTCAASKPARRVAQAAAVDVPYERLEELEPGISRVLAHNPSAFTYYGTQTYLAGTGELAVIDPGPNLPEHLDA